MDENDDIADRIWLWLNEVNQPESWLQIAIIASCLLLAWAMAHITGKYLLTHSQDLARRDLKRITRQSLKRILFPLSALLLVIISRGVLHYFGKPAQLLNIAIPLLLSYAGIRLLIYILRKSFRASPLLKASENIIASSIWLFVALYLLDLWPAIKSSMQEISFSIGSSQFNLFNIVSSLLYIAIFFTLALWFSAYLEKKLRASSVLNASVKIALAKFFKFAIITFAILIGLDTAGIDLTALAVFGGALGVGLGFGLQRIASNFISGFLLVFDKSIKPGDTISIGTKFGWVEQMNARYIVVRDRDGVETLIPNENLITSEVINWSYRDRNVRLKIPVTISYKNDPELAMDLLVQAAEKVDRILHDPAPAPRLMRFGDNGIELELRVWIDDPQEGLNSIRSAVNVHIWRLFKEHNISIPYPQRDVHLVNAEE